MNKPFSGRGDAARPAVEILFPRTRSLASVFLGVLGFGLLGLLEAGAAASLHPLWLVCWAFVSVAVSFGAMGPGRSHLRLGLALVLLGTGLGLRAAEWDSRKPFLRDFYRIHPGMSVEEADAIMSRWMQGTGWPANPLAPAGNGELHVAGSPRSYPATHAHGELQLEGARVYRHTNEGWGDSDWGIVEVNNGRVVSVSFSHD